MAGKKEFSAVVVKAFKSYYTTRAERWCRWRRAGLDGLVSLKGGLRRV